MGSKKTTNQSAEAPPEERYRAAELIRAAKGVTRDILKTVLSPCGMYTLEERDRLVAGFKCREVR